MSITNRVLNRLCAAVNGCRVGCSMDTRMQVRERKFFAHDRIMRTNINDKFKVMKPGSIVFPPDSAQLPALAMEPPVFPLPSGQMISKKKKDFANTKRTFEFRHYEYIHDKLWYNQYGLQALAGGMLEPSHYALIRAAINRNMNDQRFAVWRVEPPWYTRTRKSKGMKRGGGKGKVHHYLLPIRRNRIIVELGGYLLDEEAHMILAPIAAKMPFACRFVKQADFDTEAQLDADIARLNTNPFNWEMFCRFNMTNCYKQLSPYDHVLRGKLW